MEIFIDKHHVDVQDVMEWIDANWEQAQNLDCTHFEPYLNVFGAYCIASLWVRGLNSVSEWETCKHMVFEDAGNGWIKCYRHFATYLYKNGSLFYITQHS
jgi:hypothetical protein